ncbi:hypothetical protein CR513_57314, partial [Mucuna pruriens]
MNVLRDQVHNVLKELKEIHDKFLKLLIALVAATNTDTGNSLFRKQHKLMMSLILIIVLYSFMATVGTILEIRKINLVPIITCAMLVLGSVVAVLALCFISTTLAWITLAMWVGMFTMVAHDYGVPQRIKNWIKELITRDQVHNVFRELKEIHDKFLTLLIALVVATNTNTGISMFTKQHKLMMSLVLIIVLYSFVATVGTILQIHNTNLLPIITCVMLFRFWL